MDKMSFDANRVVRKMWMRLGRSKGEAVFPSTVLCIQPLRMIKIILANTDNAAQPNSVGNKGRRWVQYTVAAGSTVGSVQQHIDLGRVYIRVAVDSIS